VAEFGPTGAQKRVVFGAKKLIRLAIKCHDISRSYSA